MLNILRQFVAATLSASLQQAHKSLGTVTKRGVRSSCFLTRLPTSGITQRRWYTSESVWIIGGMIMIGKSQSTRRKTWPLPLYPQQQPLELVGN